MSLHYFKDNYRFEDINGVGWNFVKHQPICYERVPIGLDIANKVFVRLYYQDFEMVFNDFDIENYLDDSYPINIKENNVLKDEIAQLRKYLNDIIDGYRGGVNMSYLNPDYWKLIDEAEVYLLQSAK